MSKEFSKWLKQATQEKGLSERAIAQYAGLAKTTVHLLINQPDRQPSTSTIRKLAKYFGESEEYLLELAGHKTPKQETYGSRIINEVVSLFRRLPPERKREELERLRLAVYLAEERAPYRAKPVNNRDESTDEAAR